MKIVRIKLLDGSYKNSYYSSKMYTDFLIRRLNMINESLDLLFSQSVEIESAIRDEINLNNHRNYVDRQIEITSRAKDAVALDKYKAYIHKQIARDDKIIPVDFLHDNFSEIFRERRNNTQKIEILKTERSKAILELGSKHVYDDNGSDYELASYINTSTVSINPRKLSQRFRNQVVVEFDEL